MTRVLVMTIPAQGHLRPALAVADELVRRGHDVDVLTTDALAPEVSAVGARAVPYVTAWDRDDGAPGAVPTSEVAAWAPLVMLAEASAQLRTAAAHLHGRPADVLLYDTTTRTAARCLAHDHGLPAVELHCSLAPRPGEPTIADLRDPVTGEPLVPVPGHPALREADDRARRLLADHAHPLRDPSVLARTPERRTLVALPAALARATGPDDPTTTWTGPLVRPARATGWRPPPSGRPVALLTFGTEPPVASARWLAARTRALVGAGFHVVVTADVTAEEVAAGSSHVEVVGWLPLPDVLPHTAVAITHSGAGTTGQCLQHAVPCLLLPRTPEQDAVGRATAALGTGRLLDHGSTAHDLAAAAAALAGDPGVAARARRVAGRAGHDGPSVAAGVVLQAAADAPREGGGARTVTR